MSFNLAADETTKRLATIELRPTNEMNADETGRRTEGKGHRPGGDSSDKPSRQYAQWTDAQLVYRFVDSGDADIFREFVHRYGRLVLSVARETVPEHLVEDVFQETFLVLAQKADVIHSPGLLSSWLYGVARRLGLRTRRRWSREQQGRVNLEVESMSDVPAKPMMVELPDESVESELRRAVDDLPDKYRAPIVLCYFLGHTHAETARILDMPVGSVAHHLKQGQQRLARRLKRRGFVIPTVALVWLLSQRRALAEVPGQMVEAAIRRSTAATAQLPVRTTGWIQWFTRRGSSFSSAVSRWMLIGFLVVAAAVLWESTGAGELVANQIKIRRLDGRRAGNTEAVSRINPSMGADWQQVVAANVRPNQTRTLCCDADH